MVKLTDAIKSNGLDHTNKDSSSFNNLINKCKNTTFFKSDSSKNLKNWDGYTYSIKPVSDVTVGPRGGTVTIPASYIAPTAAAGSPNITWSLNTSNSSTGASISSGKVTVSQNDTSLSKIFNVSGTCKENTINLTATAKITQSANKSKSKIVFKNNSGYALQVYLNTTINSTKITPTISFTGQTTTDITYGGKAVANFDQTLTCANNSTVNSKEFTSVHTSVDYKYPSLSVLQLPIYVTGPAYATVSSIPVSVDAAVEIRKIVDDSYVCRVNYYEATNGYKSGVSYAQPLFAENLQNSSSSIWRVNLDHDQNSFQGASGGGTNYLSDENSAIYYAYTTITITFRKPGGGGTPEDPDPGAPDPSTDYYYYRYPNS